MGKLGSRSFAAVVQRNLSAVTLTAFELNGDVTGASVKPLDISLRAAQGLIDNMDDILPVHDSDQLDVNQALPEAIFFRWNMLELLLHWVQFRGEWLDHMPSFTSRLLWQLLTSILWGPGSCFGQVSISNVD